MKNICIVEQTLMPNIVPLLRNNLPKVFDTLSMRAETGALACLSTYFFGPQPS